ncbi:MAG TPA: formyltransferase family protein [Chitinophagales bacterium]|nr:formyltransferase family protein [Chitinophagales bacterium]HRK25801.1 formyltransferase family protein [Chitinophagales bacterium]
MKKVVFLGAKAIGLHCLQLLLQKQSAYNYKVTAIGTAGLQNQYNQQINNLAEQYQVKLIRSLAELPPCDVLISVQYHRILKQQHIDLAGQIAVNLHMAPLPEYRGCNQFSFAIVNNDSQFGVTLHQLEAGIDSGAILFEKRFPIPPNCWVTDLYRLAEEQSGKLFEQHLADIVHGKYNPVAQQNLIPDRGTAYHFRHEIEQLKQIDLNWSAQTIERHVRATWFPPNEPPYTFINGKKFYFQGAEQSS